MPGPGASLTFDVEAFLRDDWQKRPRLIRNGWAQWTNPLEPDELAGLACENEVESRLITHASREWALSHGPLGEDQFGQLGKEPWTLLVQAVDHHVPAVADLLRPFRFIPNWRVDDVMVSYAIDGGGVGPHFDQYDVFLVQGLGRRRWQIGEQCDDATPLLPHPDLRLLAQFEPVEEWILEPGDVLYVPPRFAHNGIAASDDCMTYSIGMRAPSRRELIANWTEFVIADLEEDDRYCDPDLSGRGNPGEIAPEAVDRLHRMAMETLQDRQAFARWFGQYSTMPKNSELDWRPEETIDAAKARALLAEGVALIRNPASRFAFVREDARSTALFVDGECFACAGEVASFAELVCAQDRLVADARVVASQPAVELMVELLNRGCIAFDAEE